MSVLEADKTTPSEVREDVFYAAEALHRQLRPKIPIDYAGYLGRMFDEGAHLAVLCDDKKRPRAVAVWRAHLTTYSGRRFYVDDLVAEEANRGEGWGGKMLTWLQDRAGALDCDSFALESGTHRVDAHGFYFKQGLAIRNFGFMKKLTERF
ncbi:GNAT family N-acetyltransferase [soil metagenome]